MWQSELMIGVSLALSTAMAATLMLVAFLFPARPYGPIPRRCLYLF